LLLVVSNTLVLIGIAILLGSLTVVRKITQRLPGGRVRKSWYAMAGLIVLFVIGYLIYILVFWNQQATLLDLIVPGIFFFGACFVWLSCLLALQTALDVMRITDLEHETFTDPLTGVYNRRFMAQRLAEEVSKAHRYQFELALLLLDLDYFKRVNDEHGHQIGDQLLIDLSALVDGQLRDSDILARYGGEEFLVIAPNTGPEDAKLLAERLRRCVEAQNFLINTQDLPELELRITVSIGVSSFGGATASGEILIRNADKNLYQAKHEGRNRVAAGEPVSG
jgi:diguanylate cyclase (GGDEF)-like protein